MQFSRLRERSARLVRVAVAAPAPASLALRDLSRSAGEVYGASQLRSLLVDCLVLWGVSGRVTAADDGVTISTDAGIFSVQPASPDMRPVRWLLQTPARRAANRPPRAAPSIVAVLSALRNALGGDGGNRLRIGSGGSAP